MSIIARGYKEVEDNEKLDRAMASNKPRKTEDEKMVAIICIHWQYDGEQFSIESKRNECISNDRYSQPQEVIRTCTPVLEPLKDVMARYCKRLETRKDKVVVIGFNVKPELVSIKSYMKLKRIEKERREGHAQCAENAKTSKKSIC